MNELRKGEERKERHKELAAQINEIIKNNLINKDETAEITLNNIEFKNDKEFKTALYYLTYKDDSFRYFITDYEYENRSITVKERPNYLSLM